MNGKLCVPTEVLLPKILEMFDHVKVSFVCLSEMACGVMVIARCAL